jgi:L-aspartate oxidase
LTFLPDSCIIRILMTDLKVEVIESDFLVIGSGVAGLVFALLAGQVGTVRLVTKKDSFESNTNYAQGGIACVLDPNDTFDSHVEDTLKAGAGLCKKEVVEILVREGPAMIGKLVEWGARFTPDEEGQAFDLGREGGHSRRRIVHAADLTGREVERALLHALRSSPNVELHEQQIAVELLDEGTGEDRRCVGAQVFDTVNRKIIYYVAPAVLLSTGGAGRVYLHNTNPPIATGDGVAMAWRQGVRVANMEFIQFHPTSFYSPVKPTFLISEAVRGEGAILRTIEGEAFMEKYHPMGNLAPRDVVARAIDTEMKFSGAPYVLLDLTHLDGDFIKQRFPHITRLCRERRVDIATEPIWVVPAAHYTCGGVETDTNGETNFHGLFATGEVACTGVHGANRLASNSLLEALVFSRRAFEHVQKTRSDYKKPEVQLGKWHKKDFYRVDESFEAVRIAHCREEIKRLMWNYVGIVRNTDRLRLAERRLEIIRQEVDGYLASGVFFPDLVELWNMATVGGLIVRSAILRKESRGLHYNTDFPKPDDANWLKDTVLVKRLSG